MQIQPSLKRILTITKAYKYSISLGVKITVLPLQKSFTPLIPLFFYQSHASFNISPAVFRSFGRYFSIGSINAAKAHTSLSERLGFQSLDTFAREKSPLIALMEDRFPGVIYSS